MDSLRRKNLCDNRGKRDGDWKSRRRVFFASDMPPAQFAFMSTARLNQEPAPFWHGSAPFPIQFTIVNYGG
jgi:hypothetical protein